MRLAIEDLFPGRIALVSSFGAEFGGASAYGLGNRSGDAGPLSRHAASVCRDAGISRRFDRAPRADQCHQLKPDERQLAEEDPEKFLWSSDPDRCCAIAQSRAFGESAGKLRRLDQRSQTLPGRDPRRVAVVRERWRAHQAQSARDLDAGRHQSLFQEARPAAASAGRQEITSRSAAFPAPRRSGPAKTRAPGAGAAAAKPNAACTFPSILEAGADI